MADVRWPTSNLQCPISCSPALLRPTPYNLPPLRRIKALNLHRLHHPNILAVSRPRNLWKSRNPRKFVGLFTQSRREVIGRRRSRGFFRRWRGCWRKRGRAGKQESRRTGKRRQGKAKRAREVEATERAQTVAAGGLRFGKPQSKTAEKQETQKIKTRNRAPAKNDPRLVAAARELRDRWLEHAAAHPGLIEQGNTADKRYDVGKVVAGPTGGDGALPGVTAVGG